MRVCRFDGFFSNENNKSLPSNAKIGFMDENAGPLTTSVTPLSGCDRTGSFASPNYSGFAISMVYLIILFCVYCEFARLVKYFFK